MFPKYRVNDELGSIYFWGIGLKHSIDQYLPGIIPIDLAVQGSYQSFGVGKELQISTMSFNAEISKKLLIWTFYGGLGYEMTELNLKYKTQLEVISNDAPPYQIISMPINIDFNVKGENNYRATIGFRYSMMFLKIFADYSLCKYPVANFGIGLSF